jgi:hypothetical protein
MEKSAWERVFAAATEQDAKTPLTWLAGKLDYSLQRVQNWSVRGIPAREYPAIAKVFGESLEWVAGLRPRKAAKGPPSDRDSLSAGAVAVGVAFDHMSVAEQEKFLKLLEVAFGASARARPKELGHSDMMDLDIDLTDHQQAARKGSKRGTGS